MVAKSHIKAAIRQRIGAACAYPVVDMLPYRTHACIVLSHYWNLHMKYYNVCTPHLEHS